MTLHALLHPANRDSRALRSSHANQRSGPDPDDTAGQLATLIVCVVAVQEARVVQRKEEKKRRQTGSLWVANWQVLGAPPRLGLELGPDHAHVGDGEQSVEVVLWDASARDWDGRVRRGDVLLLQSMYLLCVPKHLCQVQLTAQTSSLNLPNPPYTPRAAQRLNLSFLHRPLPKSPFYTAPYHDTRLRNQR
jgi:hypothetical protein